MNYKLNKLFVVLLAGIIALLAVSTFVEQARGAAFVADNIYHTWWFFSLWAVLALLSVVVICRQRLWRRFAVFMLHLSFLVILLGAATTFVTSHEGVLHLRVGVPTKSYLLTKTGEAMPLPFDALTLDSFRVAYYAGTTAPQDFVSHISYQQNRDGNNVPSLQHATVSMNHILSYQGYRFYQSSFDADQQGSVLSVSYDPWGTPLTYAGYALLAFSIILLLLGRHETFRTMLRSPLLRRSWIVLALLTTAAGFPSAMQARSVPTIQREQADRLARMPVVYNDRVAPLSTLAHDFTQKLYGRDSYRGLTAEQVVYGWLQRPDAWKDEPMLRIKDSRLRQQLGISGQYATFAQLFDGQEYRLQGLIATGGDNKAIRELDEKVGLILMLTNGSLIRPAKGYEISEHRISAEILYNRVPFTKWLFMANLTLGLLAFLLLLAPRRTAFYMLWQLVVGLLWLSALTLLFAYLLRAYISGRLPLANGYETMQFMALSLMAVTLIAHRRFPIALPFGLLLSGFTLLVAWLGAMNPQITPLMPVLQSPLLSIHVSTVMMAYALLAFCMLNGLYALLIEAHRHSTERAAQIAHLTLLSRLMLYPAVFLLAVGIFLGAVWANVSWGRYWSWDPKEVWALITLLIYAVPLHQHSLPIFRMSRWFHLYMVLAFLAVLMTYFGVNYFLGGMHSYA